MIAWGLCVVGPVIYLVLVVLIVVRWRFYTMSTKLQR